MKPIIALSSCILGNKVRYDGGDTHNGWVTQKLQIYFELRPVCPEMEMGLGSPREPMNLILDNLQNIQLVTTQTKKNLTVHAHRSIQQILEQDHTGICGHIFQQKSPSCGLNQVKLYNTKEELIETSEKNLGLYALSFTQKFPSIPVIEAIDLANHDIRDNFLRRVMAYYRFSTLSFSLDSLLDFHQSYELIIAEHNPNMTNQLKMIITNDKNDDHRLVFSNYQSLFFKTLGLLPSKKNILFSLHTLMTFFLSIASSDEEKVLLKIFNEYKNDQATYKETIKCLAAVIKNDQKYNFLKKHRTIDAYLAEL